MFNIWTHWHQLHYEEWCMQKIMMLTLTIMTIQPDCTSWICHWQIQPKTLAGMTVYRHKYKDTDRWHFFNSIHIDLVQPNQPKIQNQSFQVHHILSKWKWLNTSSLKTTTDSQVEVVQKHFYEDQHILPKWKFSKISAFKTTTPHSEKY